MIDVSREASRHRLFGLRIDNLTMDETVQRCLDATDSCELLEVGVVNAAKIVKMRQDPALREAVEGCDVVVADGQSVVWASRLRCRTPRRHGSRPLIPEERY